MKLPFLISAFCCLLCVCGCTSIKYSRTEPGGENITFGISSFATKKTLKEFDYSTNPNGTRRIALKGYNDNQTEVIQAAIAAALEAYIRQQQQQTGTNITTTTIIRNP